MGDQSAEVRVVKRVVRGAGVDVVGEGTVSGDGGGGRVRARAMLQALAPRSRMWGNERLMSCVMGYEVRLIIVDSNDREASRRFTSNLSHSLEATSSRR